MGNGMYILESTGYDNIYSAKHLLPIRNHCCEFLKKVTIVQGCRWDRRRNYCLWRVNVLRKPVTLRAQ